MHVPKPHNQLMLVTSSQQSLTARRTVPAFDTTTLTSANADWDGFGCVIHVQSAKHHA